MKTLKSFLTAEMSMLPYKFFDLDEAGKLKPELEEKAKVNSKDLFSYRQDQLDSAKKRIKKERFDALIALYFAQMHTADGFDFQRLERDIQAHQPVMDRHLGKPWVHHLKIMIKLAKEIEPKTETPKKGLLGRP